MTTAVAPRRLERIRGTSRRSQIADITRLQQRLVPSTRALLSLLNARVGVSDLKMMAETKRVPLELDLRLSDTITAARPTLTRIAVREAIAKQDLPPLSATTAEQLASRGIGQLIRQLTDQQRKTVREQLAIMADQGVSPDILRVIAATTGLTKRQVRAVANFRRKRLEAGASTSDAEQAAKQYARRLRNQRAKVIARTEAVRYTNSIVQERGAELERMGKRVLKQSVSARDERVDKGVPPELKVCRLLDNGRRIPISEMFDATGQVFLHPPYHVMCRCIIELFVENKSTIVPTSAKPAVPDPLFVEPDTPSPLLAEDLRQFEESITGLTFERGAAWDLTGNRIFEKTGAANNIQFTDKERTELMFAAVFTHNHPHGTSLSVDDLVVARYHNIRELRAVGLAFDGRSVTYRAFLGEAPASVTIERIIQVDRLANQFVEDQLRPRFEAGELTSEEAIFLHTHMVNDLLSKQLGYRYERYINGVLAP